MVLVNEIRLTNLNNGLYAQFMADVKKLILKFTPKALKVSGSYKNYETWLEKFNAAYVRQVKNNLTASLEEKDKERDDRYRCFFAHVKADLYNGDPKKREAAQRVLNRIESLPNVLKSSRRKQSAEMTEMGDALSTGTLATDVETIGQTENLNMMIAANEEYIELSDERSESRKDIQLNAVRDAREGLDDAYREVVSMVNAQITYNALIDESDLEEDSEPDLPEVQSEEATTDVLTEFAKILNAKIKEYKIEAEQSGSDKDSDETKEPDKTPETPDKEEEDDTTTETPENPDEGEGETPETPSEGEGETETPEEPDDRPVVQ